MTTPTGNITCDAFADRLMDLLEGDLDAQALATMQAHAATCATCAALLADIRRIEHDASALPTLRPSRDLWDGIRQRIQAPVVPLAPRMASWRSPRVLGVAAAAAIVLAAGLGYQFARHTGAPVQAPVQVAAQLPAADAAPAATLQPSAVAGAAAATAQRPPRASLAANRAERATPQAVEHSYDAEISGLRAIIAQRHSQLDSATVAILDHNLSVIDSAIVQCKAALARDPHSQFLMRSLNQSLDTKVQLLRMTAGLPSAT